jgi:hypothetical protein
VNVKKDSARRDSAGDATADTVERRRIGRVVRDDRDSAVVEWIDAPSDYQRVHLSIEGESARPDDGLKRASKGYNPYETISPSKKTAAPDQRPAKRDLRKLSAWIKQMREIEARKQRGDDQEDD